MRRPTATASAFAGGQGFERDRRRATAAASNNDAFPQPIGAADLGPVAKDAHARRHKQHLDLRLDRAPRMCRLAVTCAHGLACDLAGGAQVPCALLPNIASELDVQHVAGVLGVQLFY